MIPYCSSHLERLHKGTEGALEALNVTVTGLWYFLGGTRTQIQHGTGSFSLWFASVPWHYWITAAEWRHNGESIAGQQGRELWLLSCWVSMTFEIPNFNLSLWRIQSKSCMQKQLSQQRISSLNALIFDNTCRNLQPSIIHLLDACVVAYRKSSFENVLHERFPDWNWFHNWLCSPDCASDTLFTQLCPLLSRIPWLWEYCQAKENIFT